ncbi:hypothetical protein HN499_05875 [archaeon]|jgi:hypothetical protein|nr:hypothetical protein [archaeon]
MSVSFDIWTKDGVCELEGQDCSVFLETCSDQELAELLRNTPGVVGLKDNLQAFSNLVEFMSGYDPKIKLILEFNKSSSKLENTGVSKCEHDVMLCIDYDDLLQWIHASDSNALLELGDGTLESIAEHLMTPDQKRELVREQLKENYTGPELLNLPFVTEEVVGSLKNFLINTVVLDEDRLEEFYLLFHTEILKIFAKKVFWKDPEK